MSDTLQADVTPPPTHDERVGRRSGLARLFRPPRGRGAGRRDRHLHLLLHHRAPFRNASSLSTILYVSSTYGLMATPIALLMIGGEFDLSAGVAVITAALAHPCSASSSP
jgi:simple sugar transport system permease protein